MNAIPSDFSPSIPSWNTIYRSQGLRWGMTPSLCAHLGAGRIARSFGRGGRVVDMGAGYGRDLAFLRTVLPSSFSLVGVEPSCEAIKLWDKVRPIDAPEMIKADAQGYQSACGAGNERADVVLCNYVLHLVPKRQHLPFLLDVRNCLNPRGMVIFSCVSSEDTRNPRVVSQTDDIAAPIPDGIKWEFLTRGDIEALLAKARLRPVLVHRFSEMEIVNGCPDLVESWYVEAAI